MKRDDRIRVLRVIAEYQAGGVESIAKNYYDNINHEVIAMDFIFFGRKLPDYCSEVENNGDRLFSVTSYTQNVVKSVLEIKKIVSDGKYDIVHSQLNTLNFFPLLGAWLGGTKIRIASNHSTANLRFEFKRSLLKYILRPTTKICATHYTACSEYAGRWCFGKRACEKGNVKVIHNAIDLESFQYSDETRKKVRERFGWNGCFVVGHVGRFTEQKNHKMLLDIFAEVRKRRSDALLVLIGDGKLRESVSNRAQALGIEESVRFLGIRSDVSELMQGMDVFLFPSLYEGLGNVITEAQAVGLQCVCSDVVPNEVKMTELVEFLPLDEPVERWAEAVIKHSDGYERWGRADELTRAGYEIKSAAKDLEEYYMGLLGRKTI